MRILRDGETRTCPWGCSTHNRRDRPPEATKLLKTTEVWKYACSYWALIHTRPWPHILIPSRLTTTPSGVSFYHPQEYIVNHGTLAFHLNAHVSLNRISMINWGNIFWRTWGLMWFGTGRMWIVRQGSFRYFKWKHLNHEGKIWRLLGCGAMGNCAKIVFQGVLKSNFLLNNMSL